MHSETKFAIKKNDQVKVYPVFRTPAPLRFREWLCRPP